MSTHTALKQLTPVDVKSPPPLKQQPPLNIEQKRLIPSDQLPNCSYKNATLFL